MSYLITLKSIYNGQASQATVTRYSAVGISKVITVACGATAADAVRRARRDVRIARHCGGVK